MTQEDLLSKAIIGAAIEVHRALGPGLLESAYEACLCHELSLKKIGYERQKVINVQYKGVSLDCGYRLDIWVEGSVIIELKAVEKILPVHEAQLLTYLKLTENRLGLLLNFHVPVMKKGIKRLVLNL
ncbi:MAG: GxxExxY protein [Mariprofundus sp.]